VISNISVVVFMLEIMCTINITVCFTDPLQVCMCVAYVIHNEDDDITPRKKRRSKSGDDDLWMPGGE